MSTTQYYVSREGKQMGPYPLNSIAEMVKKNELTMLDYLYDDSSGDWVLLMEYQDLAQQLKDHKPEAPPKPGSKQPAAEADTEDHEEMAEAVQAAEGQPSHMVAEWYILKGKINLVPFPIPTS